jgi:signal recognition particle GTPase
MSWLQKLKQGLSKSSQKVSESLKSLSSLSSLIGASKLDASSLEEVEDALIGADLGTASAARLAAAMRTHKFDGPVTANSLAEALAERHCLRFCSQLPHRFCQTRRIGRMFCFWSESMVRAKPQPPAN